MIASSPLSCASSPINYLLMEPYYESERAMTSQKQRRKQSDDTNNGLAYSMLFQSMKRGFNGDAFWKSRGIQLWQKRFLHSQDIILDTRFAYPGICFSFLASDDTTVLEASACLTSLAQWDQRTEVAYAKSHWFWGAKWQYYASQEGSEHGWRDLTPLSYLIRRP